MLVCFCGVDECFPPGTAIACSVLGVFVVPADFVVLSFFVVPADFVVLGVFVVPANFVVSGFFVVPAVVFDFFVVLWVSRVSGVFGG